MSTTGLKLVEQGQGVDMDEDELIVETRNIQAEFNNANAFTA